MRDAAAGIARETLIMRLIWMLVFFFVWRIGEFILLVLVILQLGLRLVRGQPSPDLARLGQGVSLYLAQIGRFGTFATEQKPWPFGEWPQVPEGRGRGGRW